MNCRNILKCYFSILIAVSLTPQPKVFAQSNSAGCQAQLYQLSKTGENPKLTASELFNGDIEQVDIDYRQQTLPTNSPYKSSATINVPRYWQMRVNNDDLPINSTSVKYTLRPSSNSNSPFTQDKFEAKVFGDIEQIETCSDNTTVITNGISLIFSELSELTPGFFQGQIDVCVQVNGNQCQ
ncbi:MAG: hypothetical protein AAFQ91_03425 [Cyanobacteria bacterium J06621_15]